MSGLTVVVDTIKSSVRAIVVCGGGDVNRAVTCVLSHSTLPGPYRRGTRQVMKDISEVRKAMDATQEIFEPLHQMVVMLKQHGVDVSGVQVAEKDVQVGMTWRAKNVKS